MKFVETPSVLAPLPRALTLDQQTSLLNRCGREWNASEFECVKSALKPDLLQHLLAFYVLNCTSGPQINQLAHVISTSVADVSVRYATRLPAVKHFFLFKTRL
jgi:hypothetical protein